MLLGIVVYGYFTTPLPFGLSSVIHTPGGSSQSTLPVVSGTGTPTTAVSTMALGLVTLTVEQVQRNVDLTANSGTGPPGAFTVLSLSIQNAGHQPVTLSNSTFTLTDDQGRVYAVDTQASNAASQAQRRRAPFDASVPPGGTLETCLAFQVAPDATTLVLQANLGAGEVALPR